MSHGQRRRGKSVVLDGLIDDSESLCELLVLQIERRWHVDERLRRLLQKHLLCELNL